MRIDGAESHPDCAAAVESTARVLEELGHDVSPARIDAIETPDIGFLGIYASAITRDLERWSVRIGRTLEPSDLDLINAVTAEMGRSVTGRSTWPLWRPRRDGRGRSRRGGRRGTTSS